MEKKQRVEGLSLGRWRDEHWTQWKMVVHFMSIRELANFRASSSTALMQTTAEEKERIPWPEVGLLAGNDMRKQIWDAKQKGRVPLECYRWLAMHTPRFDPALCFVTDHLKPAYFGYAIVAHVMYSLLAGLKSRRYAFGVNPTSKTFFIVTNNDIYHINCQNAVHENCCLQPGEQGAYDGDGDWWTGCGQGRGCPVDYFEELGDLEVRSRVSIVDFKETVIDEQSGLRCWKNYTDGRLLFPFCSNLQFLITGGTDSFLSTHDQGLGAFNLDKAQPFNFDVVGMDDFIKIQREIH